MHLSRRTVLAAVLVALGGGAGLAARAAGYSAVHVTSGSMAPTIDRGDWIVVRSGARPHRGDVVMFSFPIGTSGRAIKRVVAVGGDRVEFSDRALTVNGVTQPIGGSPTPGRRGSLTVPAGEVFLLGDHASVSIDSRAFGTVPAREIVAKVVLNP